MVPKMIIFLVLVWSASVTAASDTPKTLAVDGSAILELTKNKVTLDFSFSTTKTSVSSSVSINTLLSNNIETALTTFGIADADISVGSYEVTQDADTGDWTVSKTITVIQTDDILNNMDTLLNDVLPLGNISFNITMSVGDVDDAYNTALVEAVQSAKARADLIATEGGFTLGDVLSMRTYTGELQVGEVAAIPISSGASAAGATVTKSSAATSTGSTVKVRVIYEITAKADVE